VSTTNAWVLHPISSGSLPGLVGVLGLFLEAHRAPSAAALTMSARSGFPPSKMREVPENRVPVGWRNRGVSGSEKGPARSTPVVRGNCRSVQKF
jgi:hypothetical protein